LEEHVGTSFSECGEKKRLHPFQIKTSFWGWVRQNLDSIRTRKKAYAKRGLGNDVLKEFFKESKRK